MPSIFTMAGNAVSAESDYEGRTGFGRQGVTC